MLITPTSLQFFFTDLETRFWTAYGAAPTFADKIATVIPVGTEQSIYGWIGMVDKMREWVGPRTVHSPAPQTYTLINQNFELTESVDKFKLEDDQFGIYYPMVQFMGIQAKKWTDIQLRDLLTNSGSQIGTRQIGLDQLTHWNTAHPVDFYDSSKGTFCNDFTGGGVVVNGVTVGGALAPTAFATLWQEMASRKSESGEALGIVPNLCMVPPQLDITAKTILHAQFFAPQTGLSGTTNVGATENMLKGSSDILMVPELAASPTVWYLMDTNKPVKPFIWQLRQAPEFVYRITPQDPVVFDTHTYVYGVTSRGAPGFSHAWLSSRSGV